jgi:hypothetical protein
MATEHTSYGPGEKSPCPHHHGLCAYTGTEPDRCPTCHMSWERIDRCDHCESREKHAASCGQQKAGARPHRAAAGAGAARTLRQVPPRLAPPFQCQPQVDTPLTAG